MNYDVVFFTLFRTDNPYSSISLAMAKELARTNRVFYVNHPYSLKDLLRGLFSGDRAFWSRLPALLTGRVRYETLDTIPRNFLAVQPPLTLPINWLPEGRMYDCLQRFNNRVILRAIRLVLRDYGVSNYLYINCYDPFFAGVLPKDMGAARCLYHCIDDITQDPYTARHGARLENETIRNADITLVTGTHLRRLKTGLTLPERLVPFFNAVDLDIFEKARLEKYHRPVELKGRQGKVVGFIGNLDALRIDYTLLKKVAEAHPDKTILLVGPVNSVELRQKGIDQLPNVVCTGARQPADLPPLLQHMDCTLIPFRCNALTQSIYPLKINEYLAAGKPVVSTAFSEDIRNFADCIYLADSHDVFIRQIDTALSENDPDLIRRRIKTAQANTWSARIRQLREVVERHADIHHHFSMETI